MFYSESLCGNKEMDKSVQPNYKLQPLEANVEDWLTAEGVQFGLGLFETMRIAEGSVEDLEAHLHRLKDSAKALNIAIPSALESGEELVSKLEPVLSAIIEPLAVMKLVLIKSGNASRWWVQTRKFSYHREMLDLGYNLCVSAVRRSSTSLMLPHKSLNYSENWLEKQKAVENGYQEVLFLNEDGFVTECSASNVFFVKDDVWYTPQLSVGLLNGIMRQRLICAIKKEKWIVKEGEYTLGELCLADQIYLTNSLMGIMPVKRLNHIEFSKADFTQEQFINNVDKNRQLFK